MSHIPFIECRLHSRIPVGSRRHCHKQATWTRHQPHRQPTPHLNNQNKQTHLLPLAQTPLEDSSRGQTDRSRQHKNPLIFEFTVLECDPAFSAARSIRLGGVTLLLYGLLPLFGGTRITRVEHYQTPYLQHQISRNALPTARAVQYE